MESNALQFITPQKLYFMKKITMGLATFFVITVAQAQNKSGSGSSYQNALGVKVWDGGGISFKHFFNEKNAGELIGYF